MKSQVCELNGEANEIPAALVETDAFAARCGLTGKTALHLRLLAEELLGMVHGVLDVQNGEFWIESEGRRFCLNLTAHAPVGEQARARLIGASSDGKDAFHRGVTGKIRQALEWLSGEDAEAAGYYSIAPYLDITSEEPNIMLGMVTLPQATEWSLQSYRDTVKREKKAEAWDELERSVLSQLSDDIRVGVRTGQVSITVYREFI